MLDLARPVVLMFGDNVGLFFSASHGLFCLILLNLPEHFSSSSFDQTDHKRQFITC